MTAFVLGNGQSRAGVDLYRLPDLGTVYGCNALYRDFQPDVLVATDRPMAQEIEATGYARTRRFYTRRPQPNSGALTVPREYFGYSSGPIAAALAAQENHDPIYLLGFDLGADQHGRFNNIYAGSANYKAAGTEPTFTGNWIRQLIRVVRDHDRQRFIRVMGETTAAVREFETIGNLASMPVRDFLARINKQKDLGCPLTSV